MDINGQQQSMTVNKVKNSMKKGPKWSTTVNYGQ